jgi:pSer/pThr/pTyr-binding forkhead associated (FHA) protein
MDSSIAQNTNVAERIVQLAPTGHWLYAILDASRDPVIIDKICTLRPEFDSLYRGRAEQTLWEVAPYLVRIEPGSEFCQWLFGEGWGKAWGIFAVSSADLAQMHRHFRKFLLVRGPKNEKLYFRYYDPRVFRVYLPTCNRQEMATIFGTISSYVMEGEDSSLVMTFSAGPEQVQCDSFGPDEQPPSAISESISAVPGQSNPAVANKQSDETIKPAAERVDSEGAARRTARIQQVILEVQKGGGAAKRTWLRPGQTLTVGRTDEADFVVPHDVALSGAHFELSCDFTACRLRSISRISGTYVNGKQVAQTDLQDRDEIAAGRTTFTVQIETDLAPRGSAERLAAARRAPEPATKTNRLVATVEVIAGPYDGITADLPAGKPLLIGRAVEKGLLLANDSSISRRHCQIEFESPNCQLTDLDSRFGTHVQGQKVTQATLRNGDTFKAGNSEFRVHITATAVPVRTLRIRKEQMDLLAGPKKADFKKRLMLHLDEILPQKGITIPPDQLEKQIDEAITRSKHYRVSRECDVAQYVEIVIAHLGGFGEKPHPLEARNILYDHRLKPEEKLAKLRAWAESTTTQKLQSPGERPV